MANKLTNEYILYLIKQYYEKPKANAEVRNLLVDWQNQADFIENFGFNFDIDNATETVLDLIGRIVGLSRQVDSVTPIVFFGFANNTSAKGFASKFNTSFGSAPLSSKFTPNYTAYQLQDPEYRKFLKIKIAKNTCSPFLASDAKISLQQVVFDAFDGEAYVVDNKDQTLSLYISPNVSVEDVRLITNLGILPKPITFNYKEIIQATPGATFGFKNNANAKGFASKFDTAYIGGILARKLINV